MAAWLVQKVSEGKQADLGFDRIKLNCRGLGAGGRDFLKNILVNAGVPRPPVSVPFLFI